MKFSERIGKSQIKNIIQIDDIDIELKNSLWNSITIFYWNFLKKQEYVSSMPQHHKVLITRIWIYFFKNKLDEMPGAFTNFKHYVKEFFFQSHWYEVYDFIEFLPNNYDAPNDDENLNNKFIDYCNTSLEEELSAYRFIGKVLSQISNEQELESIKEAIENTDKFTSVKVHLVRAVELFSDRKNPDYRNSIKESISAVEAFCSILTDDKNATLGQALKKLESKIELHEALKKAFSNLYGYTSNADGIRHALLEENNLGQEDAKFMLVSCSAFVNYLQEKNIKSNS